MRLTEIILVFLITTLSYCHSSIGMNSSQSGADTIKLAKVLEKGGSDRFLALFTEIAVDTFHVYSVPTFYDDPKFLGKQIGKQFNSLFAFDTVLTYSLIEEGGIDRFYACYKFKLDSNNTGLLIRIPSQYATTAVDLFIWDNKKNRITNRESLSDGFGDEGWHFVQDAWISDFNRDGLFDILKRRKDHEVDIDDTTKVSSSDSTSVFLASGNKFSKRSIRIDTIKFQLKHWIP